MQTKNLNVLLVDSHPLILEANRNALSQIQSKNSEVKFKVDTAKDYAFASSFIKDKIELKEQYDIAILDLKLPPINCSLPFSGEKLALLLKESFKSIKLIVLTQLDENFILYHALKTIQPDGILLKRNTGSKELYSAISTILNNLTYYESEMVNLMRQNIANEFQIDSIDRELLYLLSKGMRNKELVKHLPLSLPAIQKRKIKLKEQLGANICDDWSLIKWAQRNGII